MANLDQVFWLVAHLEDWLPVGIRTSQERVMGLVKKEFIRPGRVCIIELAWLGPAAMVIFAVVHPFLISIEVGSEHSDQKVMPAAWNADTLDQNSHGGDASPLRRLIEIFKVHRVGGCVLQVVIVGQSISCQPLAVYLVKRNQRQAQLCRGPADDPIEADKTFESCPLSHAVKVWRLRTV